MKPNISRKTLHLTTLAVFAAVFLVMKSHSVRETSSREMPILSETPIGAEKTWLVYADSTFHYSVHYPAGLNVVPLTNEPGGAGLLSDPDGGVSFADLGPGIMGVKVYTDVPFDSLEEWLASENKEKERIRKEKTITIDGHEALVTYYVSVTSGQEELFIQEKRTVILKDGDLFEIWTKFYEDEGDHARVWDSFRFQK